MVEGFIDELTGIVVARLLPEKLVQFGYFIKWCAIVFLSSINSRAAGAIITFTRKSDAHCCSCTEINC